MSYFIFTDDVNNKIVVDGGVDPILMLDVMDTWTHYETVEFDNNNHVLCYVTDHDYDEQYEYEFNTLEHMYNWVEHYCDGHREFTHYIEINR